MTLKKGIDYIGVAAGAMVFNNQGKVLLSRRGPLARNDRGKWDFPGGSIEFGETCEQAVQRELKEEFDIDVEVVEFLEVVDHILLDEKQHWVAPSYIAVVISGEPNIMESGKLDDWKWADISEIDETILTDASRSNYRAYVKKYGASNYYRGDAHSS